MWIFAGGPPEQFVFYYHYHHSRSHETPLNFFAEFKGYINCDGFSGYDSLASANAEIIQVGCIYHARRKFAEVIKITKAKEGVTVTVINMISKIAAIEEEIKPFPPLNQ